MRKILILAMVTVFAGCATMQNQKAPVTIEFRPGSQSPKTGLTKMTASGSQSSVYISEDVALSNADVKSARVKRGANGPQIEIVFTKAGTERFAQTTEHITGKLLGILVDGQLISAPRVMEKISGGKAVITGNFSEEEAKRIASGITGK
jgi:preprotein translocase subunit SecD